MTVLPLSFQAGVGQKANWPEQLISQVFYNEIILIYMGIFHILISLANSLKKSYGLGVSLAIKYVYTESLLVVTHSLRIIVTLVILVDLL